MYVYMYVMYVYHTTSFELSLILHCCFLPGIHVIVIYSRTHKSILAIARVRRAAIVDPEHGWMARGDWRRRRPAAKRDVFLDALRVWHESSIKDIEYDTSEYAYVWLPLLTVQDLQGRNY